MIQLKINMPNYSALKRVPYAKQLQNNQKQNNQKQNNQLTKSTINK